MSLVGKRILVEYNVGGPRLYHERLVVEWIREETYVVVTPDRDIYAEDLSVSNPDIRTLKMKPSDRGLPAGVVAGEVYALPRWGENQLRALREEAGRVAQDEGGSGPPAAAVVAPVLGGADGGALKWVAAESVGPHAVGEEIPAVTQQKVKGAKAVHALAGGESIYVECIAEDEKEAFFRRRHMQDPRVLPLVMNPLGQPERSLRDAGCKEAVVKWSIAGPRTSKWCLNYLAIENLGFEGHHERVRQICKADAGSWGIQEHFQVSMALRQAILVDQLDAYNLLSVEVQFRRLQTIEFSYSEKAKEAEAKAVGGRLSLEEQTCFGGVTRQYSTLMICPDLLDHVKAETEKEASLAKNLRKAREERDAARKKKGKQEDP